MAAPNRAFEGIFATRSRVEGDALSFPDMGSVAGLRIAGMVRAWLAGIAVFAVLADCGGVGSSSTAVNDVSVGGMGGAGTAGASAAGGDGCVVDGEFYPVGATYYPTNMGCGASCVCQGQGVAPQCSGGRLLVYTPTCDYGGLRLPAGTTVPAIDDCNTCSCPETGATCYKRTESMICTTHDCSGACSYAGRTYTNGASFPATDGCNQCSCTNGVMSCDNVACTCSPKSEPWRLYQKTNASECATFEASCPQGTSAFSNACGCGCEQSLDCPTPNYGGCPTNWDDGGVPNGNVFCPSAVVCPIVTAIPL